MDEIEPLMVSQVQVPRRKIAVSHTLYDEEMNLLGPESARNIAIQKLTMWGLAHRVVFAHPTDLEFRWVVQARVTGFEFPDDELYDEYKTTALDRRLDPLLIARINDKNWRLR